MKLEACSSVMGVVRNKRALWRTGTAMVERARKAAKGSPSGPEPELPDSRTAW